MDSPTHNNNLPGWDCHSDLVPLPVFMRELLCAVPASKILDVNLELPPLPEVDKIVDTATQTSHSLQKAKLLWGLIPKNDPDPTQMRNIINGVRRFCVLVAEQEQLLNTEAARVEVMDDDIHYLTPLSRAAFEDGALLAMVPPEDDSDGEEEESQCAFGAWDKPDENEPADV